MSEINVWQSIVLGIVEGLTEYLPISSTGHLILAERAMGIEKSTTVDAYTICIQAGAILAVLGLYFSRVKDMTLGVLGKNPAGLRMALNIIVAFLPAAIVGVLSKKKIDEHLMHLWPVTIAWLVGGIAILAVEWFKPSKSKEGLALEQLTLQMALIIGLIQCCAMIPGTSRSLVTIVGGLLVGLRLAAAVEFSFLLGLLTLTAATVYDGAKHGREMVDSFGWPVLIAGLIAAWLSAFIAVKWMVAFLQRRGFVVFGYYRVALAFIVGALILSGHLSGD
jgi:undecaprenyl-diphosphatase